MKIQSTTWYVIYNKRSTKSLTQFKLLWNSIPNLGEEQYRFRAIWELSGTKQMKRIVQGCSQLLPCSSRFLDQHGFLDCYGRRKFRSSSILSPIAFVLPQQHFKITCKFRIYKKICFQLMNSWWILQKISQKLWAKDERNERMWFLSEEFSVMSLCRMNVKLWLESISVRD